MTLMGLMFTYKVLRFIVFLMMVWPKTSDQNYCSYKQFPEWIHFYETPCMSTIENVNLITYIWFLWSIVWHTIDVSGQYVVFHPAPSLTNRHRRLPPVTAPATKLRSAFIQMLPSSLLCYKATDKDSIVCAPSCYLRGFKFCSQQGVAAEFKCHCCMQRPDSAPWQLPDGTSSSMPDGIQIIELPKQLPKTYDPCEHPPAERCPPVLAGTAAAVTRDYSWGRALRPTGLGGNEGRLTVCTEVRLADWTAGRFDMTLPDCQHLSCVHTRYGGVTEGLGSDCCCCCCCDDCGCSRHVTSGSSNCSRRQSNPTSLKPHPTIGLC